jgi:hypothetical protein
MKIAKIDVKDDFVDIQMVPTSFQHNQEPDKPDDDIIYPEGVIDFRPYKTVARYRKAIGGSTNFRERPLLVGEDSTETLILGLESFAQQHGCELSFTNEDQQFDQSVYHAACGIADLGSIHLLATDSLLTATFQFEWILTMILSLLSQKIISKSLHSTFVKLSPMCFDLRTIMFVCFLSIN